MKVSHINSYTCTQLCTGVSSTALVGAYIYNKVLLVSAVGGVVSCLTLSIAIQIVLSYIELSADKDK